MGNVLGPAFDTVSSTLAHLFHRPDMENPTLANLEALQRAEEAQRRAEETARDAHALAEQIQRKADQDLEAARARQEEADMAAAWATEETRQLRVQMEEAMNTAKHAQQLTEAATHAAREEATKLVLEAREERELSKRMQEEAERAMAAVKEEVDRMQHLADEQRREAEAAKALAEDIARTAAEETRKANEAKAEAERRLKEGIRPIEIPSPAELAAAKRRMQYREDCFHFAIAGVSGSGKSSLVNAFRGLRSRAANAAAVGVTETTLQITRYPDPNPDNPFAWYDIPGAGTLKCSDWQYFNDQGLYVFDCIIVLVDGRFTTTDVAILMNAQRFRIPTYIVRSKADQHIQNMVKEMEDDSEEDNRGDVEHRNKTLYKTAEKQFIEETRRSVRLNLQMAHLPDQRTYIVSNTTLFKIVRYHKIPGANTIDELELLNDLISQAYIRRSSTQSVEVTSRSVD